MIFDDIFIIHFLYVGAKAKLKIGFLPRIGGCFFYSIILLAAKFFFNQKTWSIDLNMIFLLAKNCLLDVFPQNRTRTFC